MAQPGNFTPILLYSSSTPTNVPLAANLTNSANGAELAINIADKNLFFKDSGGTVNTVPIRQSSTSSNGWLSNTDWNTFNNKAPATSGTSLLYGNGSGGFSNVTIGSGISFAGGTLSATGSGGTVTSVSGTGTVNGLTLTGTVTTSGSLTLGGTLNLSSPPVIGNTTPAAITGTTITANTQFVSENYYAQSILGGNLRTSGGTSLLNWDGGGSGNVTVNGGLLANPNNKNVSIAPTGTGTATINPATAGTINNMVIGGTTPLAITGTTITATTFSGSGASLTSIPNSALINSTISGVALGGNLFNLTAGTGVSFSAGTTYNGSAAITINATGTGGTVTSVAALTLGTTGTDLSSTVANGTTTPVITLNVPTASATNRGALSAADWTTFNSKQPAGSYLTAVSVVSANGFAGTSSGGTTPALTLSTSITGILKGNGIAISAATSGTDYAPATSGTSILYGNGAGGFSNVTIGTGLTFVGGTLASTASGGTVTSVAATVPAFLSISGSPITTSGTLAITLSGTALPVANGGTGITNLTANYIPYGNGTSAFSSSANITFNGTKLTLANDASIAGLTVGLGGGAISTNTAFGVSALTSNTTATNNVAVGYQAGYTNSTGIYNTFIGNAAGYAATGNLNTFVGGNAGLGVTSGTYNTFLGAACGYLITTGEKNTIIGNYSGNNGGLDIRTASNYVVLSDGDGNPRGVFDSSGNLLVGTTTQYGSAKLSVNGSIASGTGWYTRAGASGSLGANLFNIQWTGSPYLWIDSTNVGQITVVSDYRLKDNVVTQTESALPRVMQLQPVKFNRKFIGIFSGSSEIEEGFIADQLQSVIPSAVYGEKDAVTEDGTIQPQSLNWAPIVSVLVKAIQEQQSLITTLQAQVTALQTKVGV
jgi:hypothetical protein